MMRVAVIITGLTLALLLASRAASTQVNTERIAYGDSVTGEITDVAYEAAYSFSGISGEIIVAQMYSLNRSLMNPLVAPNLILRDPNNNLLVDTAAVYPVDDTTLVAELPADGDYLLIATRESGPNGTSYGAYHLTLNRVPVLDGEAVNAEITPEEGMVHYAVRQSAPFSVTYVRQSGDYAPRLSVSRMDAETGALLPLAYAGGTSLSDTCLGVFESSEPLVVTLQPDELAFDLAAREAIYALRLIHAECPAAR